MATVFFFLYCYHFHDVFSVSVCSDMIDHAHFNQGGVWNPKSNGG